MVFGHAINDATVGSGGNFPFKTQFEITELVEGDEVAAAFSGHVPQGSVFDAPTFGGERGRFVAAPLGGVFAVEELLPPFLVRLLVFLVGCQGGCGEEDCRQGGGHHGEEHAFHGLLEYNGASPMTCRQVPLLVPESEKSFQGPLEGWEGTGSFGLLVEKTPPRHLCLPKRFTSLGRMKAE